MRGTVLITGATSGIGASLAKEFSDHDYRLVITSRSEAELLALKVSLDSDIEIVVADLSTEDGVMHLIDSQRNQDIDILVNNAAQLCWGNFHEHDAKTISDLLAVNIQALTTLSQHFVKAMVQRGTGKILNVASVAGFQSVPAMGLYAASKAYVISLSESMSEQLRGTGVSVTALCPGVTDTASTSQWVSELPDVLISSPEDVARAAFDALMAGEPLTIPGIANKTAVTLAQFQPRSVIRRIGGIVARLVPFEQSK